MKKSFIILILSFLILIGCSKDGDDKIEKELLINGGFSQGLLNWENKSVYMGTNTPYNKGVIILNEENEEVLELIGTEYGNYYIKVSQEINIDFSYSKFLISFDWKVTQKDLEYGFNGVDIYFYDELGNILGYFTAIDTSDSRHTTAYKQGDIPDDCFKEFRKESEVFDWERISFDTSKMQGLEAEKVKTISVVIIQSNDAGYGGVSRYDNLSIIGKE